VLPLSVSSILSFTSGHSAAAYTFFIVFPHFYLSFYPFNNAFFIATPVVSLVGTFINMIKIKFNAMK
jgi:hypothetical protein